MGTCTATMDTAYLATVLLLVVVPAQAQPPVKRDPAPVAKFAYGAQQTEPGPAWFKTLQKQRSPQYNSIIEDSKIPVWVNPWAAKPVQGLPIKRSRFPFRFRFFKDEETDPADGAVEKRGDMAADVDMKRAEDKVFGLNSVPMMGKRMFQYFCPGCAY